MNNKGILIGVFVNKGNILSFFEKIKNKFNVPLNKLFVFTIECNDNEYLATFKAEDKKFLSEIENASVLHVKNGCLFSINALNRLIEKEKGNNEVPNNEFPLNWGKYKNKLVILTNGQLNIKNLTKIEDKAYFLL